MSQKPEWDGIDRRSTPIEKDHFYRIMIGVNILVWLVFVAAMLVLHYARPDFITGLQRFWGIPGREAWLSSLQIWLLALLGVCIALSLIVIYMQFKRTRRKNETLGINAVVLSLIATSALVWIYWELSRSRAEPTALLNWLNSSGAIMYGGIT